MIGFILNIPYTFIGLIVGIVSIPMSVEFRKNPYAIVLKIKRFWWVFGYMKNARAMAIGHTVLLSPKIEDRDLEHELVHVQQHERMPIIQPILYYIELFRKGYRNNKYEDEAYRIAGNIYKGK
jgi:predicted TIM-barrel fold metal-dependent hydrolase